MWERGGWVLAAAPSLAPRPGTAGEHSGRCRTGTLTPSPRPRGPFGRSGIRRAQAAGRAAGAGAAGFPFPGSDPNGAQPFPRHGGLGRGTGSVCSCFGGVSIETRPRQCFRGRGCCVNQSGVTLPAPSLTRSRDLGPCSPTLPSLPCIVLEQGSQSPDRHLVHLLSKPLAQIQLSLQRLFIIVN